MATAEQELVAVSSKTPDETPNESYVATKLRLVRLIVIQSSLGQRLLNVADNFLWTVEKCTEWSLPAQEIVGEDGKSFPKPEYVRPLPWYLFLPSLVLIRTIRMMLNAGARILGYSEVTPSKMVKVVQKVRRRVHTMKISGLKNKQDIKDKRLSMHEARKALIRSIRLTLSTLSCLDASKPSLSPPPTRIHVNSAFGVDASPSLSLETSTLVGTARSSDSSDSTMKDTLECFPSSTESEDSCRKAGESLNQMIDRLAEENSADDEDFNLDDYKGSSSTESDSDEDGVDNKISTVELSAIIEEASELLIDRKSTGDESDAEGSVKQEDPEKPAKETSSEDKVKQTSEKAAEQASKSTIGQAVKQNSMEATKQEQNSEGTTKQDPKGDLAQVPQQRPSSEENRAKVDDRLTSSRSHDSLECYTPDPSSQEGDLTFYSPISSDSDTPKERSTPSTIPTADKIAKTNQFINGEVHFASESMISEPKSSMEEANNGAIVEKRSANVSKIQRGKRTSHGNRKKK